jgi:GNAT superfamily N-acetyltransferase
MRKRGGAIGLEERDVTLRDGTRALIRPIRPDDKRRLQEGLRQLSPHSRYLRFHTAVDRLTDAQLRYLTEIDYHDHMAWVAINPDEPDEPGMGVGRYVRLREDPTVAEAAVTVLDRYQGRGLGTTLLQFLGMSAIENGISTFRSYVLAENQAMLDILDELGATRVDEGEGVYRVDVPVPDEPARLHEHATHRLLREVARGVVRPFRLAFPVRAPARPRDDDPPQPV